VDRAIGLSESIASTAHVLDELAARFPPAAEAELAPADRTALWNMRGRHAARLSAGAEALAGRLEEDRGVRIPERAATGFEPGTAALVRAAAETDALVTALYTNSRATNQIPRLNQELGESVAELRGLAREYARRVEEARATTR
jgi:hypothetical protein